VPKIDAKEKAIRDVFHRDYAFSIPAYQRPYSWGADQAKTLLSDLLSASDSFHVGMDVNHLTPYFLGSIVVIKQDNQPEAQVIDGQQRLTTLALLISALRTLFTDDKRKATFGEFVLEQGDRPSRSRRTTTASIFLCTSMPATARYIGSIKVSFRSRGGGPVSILSHSHGFSRFGHQDSHLSFRPTVPDQTLLRLRHIQCVRQPLLPRRSPPFSSKALRAGALRNTPV
jgi:hypothetical protein